MHSLHKVSFILMAVGALNWGLVGLLDFNLVSTLVGAGSPLEKIIYILVGAAAVHEFIAHPKICKACMSGKK